MENRHDFRTILFLSFFDLCGQVAFYAPPNIAPPPPRPCASPCIFSLTFTLTSKNLATQRSRQTDSPLFRSASRYVGSMHLELQDLRSLAGVVRIEVDGEEYGIGGLWEAQERYKRAHFVPAVHVADHVDFSFCLGDFLLAGDLGAAAHAEEGHFECVYVCGIAYAG